MPGEKEFKGKGVSYCAVCDGPLFKNKTVVIVGTGESALEAAIYLKQLASKVNIIHRTDKHKKLKKTFPKSIKQK